MEALTRRGTIVEGAADWRKGSTWVLEREDGVVVRAHAVPSPALISLAVRRPAASLC